MRSIHKIIDTYITTGVYYKTHHAPFPLRDKVVRGTLDPVHDKVITNVWLHIGRTMRERRQ